MVQASTLVACQSSSDKGSYWDESSTEEEDEGAAEEGAAGAAEASDEGPPAAAATLLPTGLLGATAMERTDSAEYGYAYVVGNDWGGGAAG